jgi:AcrR family transcriptional regulator
MSDKPGNRSAQPLFAKANGASRSTAAGSRASASPRLATLAGKQRSLAGQQAAVERICEAGLELFVQKGYRATTIDEIAKRGRLTKGAIYYYFKSKAELFREIVDRVEASYPRRKPEQGDPREKLVGFMHTQAKWAIERPNNLFLLILMSIEFKDARNDIKRTIDRIYAEMSNTVAEILEEGKAKGVFRSTIPSRQLGAFYVAAHDGLMLEWYRAGRAPQKGIELVRALRYAMLSTLT